MFHTSRIQDSSSRLSNYFWYNIYNLHMFCIKNASMQLRPLAALLARPTFSGLWSQNCLKKEHVFWEDVIFWITCLSG